MEEMWELFSQVKVNIPLVKLIKEVPSYAKFLKDLCIQKRKFQAHLPKLVELTENASSIISNNLPPKLKDPGAPLISVTIGNVKIKKALLDLGASVNILPGNLFDEHDLGTLEKTDIILQLADKSTRIPRGVLSNVIVKVDDFYYPADFIVLDNEDTCNSSQPTIILGRPILATMNAQINCRSGAMDVSFGNKKMTLNVFHNFSNAPSEPECNQFGTCCGATPYQPPNIMQPDPLEVSFDENRFKRLEMEDLQGIFDGRIPIEEDKPPWMDETEEMQQGWCPNFSSVEDQNWQDGYHAFLEELALHGPQIEPG